MSRDAAGEPAARFGPLHGRHVAAGARFADFGGWSMPLEYPGGGVLREHAAVREAVGVFDVSHLGKALVRGPGAAGFVNACLTNDLGRIAPGRAQYTLCCDDATGGVVDDLVAYLRSDHEVFLVPNAANAAEVVARLRAAAPDGVEVTDLHVAHAVLAVQGPRSDEVLDAVGLPAGHAYMSFVDTTWRGVPVTVCRTGYTGEHGYELLPRWEDAGELWDALLPEARTRGGLPAGLGARDTLRTEMGYALHGHELSLEVTPVMAGLAWAVGWDKPAFWAKDVLIAQRAAKAGPLSRGLLARDRGVLRPGLDVVAGDGRPLGRTTSGTFSPTLRRGIALALLDRSARPGDEVAVDVRGRLVRCDVVTPPFVDVQP
jgi:aminomethyltransferase